MWAEGATRLLDYGAAKCGAGGLPVLVVPSLINRAYILDLAERVSLMRYLARRGLRPFLVDWGWPGAEERGFTLSDYIAGRLEAALEAVIGRAGAPAAVVGYCMGGLLALALAERRRREVSALALLATPWDFHVHQAAQARLLAATMAGPVSTLVEGLGRMPVDLVQALFGALDPLLVPRKFVNFARLDPDSPRAAAFVALEDWLNDGVPLVAGVARECLCEWYGENAPGRGAWRVGGRRVRPERVGQPALVVVPAHDRIVPPASAEALVERLPKAEAMTPALGHIGMIVGSRAEAAVWRPLARWLGARLRDAR